MQLVLTPIMYIRMIENLKVVTNLVTVVEKGQSEFKGAIKTIVDEKPNNYLLT